MSGSSRSLLRRGEPFGKLGFGVPYFRPCYEFFRWWSWLLVAGFETGDVLLNAADVPGEVPIPLAHNALVKAFLDTDADTLCIIEDDHSADQEIVRRMREKRENWEFDIVCASYTNRRPPIAVVGVNFSGDVNEYGEYECVIEPLKVADTGTQEYDCAALGLALVRRWVVIEMLGDRDPEEFFWFDWRGRNSQDIQFYAQARAAGARVGVDRDNPIAHWGKKGWTMDDFYRWREDAIQRMTQEATNG